MITKFEDYTLGRENSLRTAHESLRLSNQSIVNLTGQNVDNLLKNLQGLSPRALEAYFQSLREGRERASNSLRLSLLISISSSNSW